ncbi:hypothetical protein RND81_08G096200 [Saponaria officinalis]|uniref:Zinc knuckle CX2CX4HX4C domain-containing protein n=1 Tax=Saponaria officinalis TaxID=3572 RepID=A0AAW1J655_SAPOF
MIDVSFGKPVPGKVTFLDELGEQIVIKVECEWNPIICSIYGGIGHDAQACKKGKQKTKPKMVQNWQPKVVVPVPKPPTDSPGLVTLASSCYCAIEKQNNFQVSQNSNGRYQVATPPRPIIRLSRQELIDKGCSTTKFGDLSFLEALNNATPRIGIGTRNSVLSPDGGGTQLLASGTSRG